MCGCRRRPPSRGRRLLAALNRPVFSYVEVMAGSAIAFFLKAAF